MTNPTLIGAVLYDPKVSTIWDIIGQFFEENKCPVDTVFYTNYELQVAALLKGHIDIAWNSPLAWLESQYLSRQKCRAIAMRDTDRDRVSHLVVASKSPISSILELRGKAISVGAKDSPQANLIPVGMLQRAGMSPDRDFKIRRFDVLVGKHGDHIGGEKDAFQSLERKQTDACAMLDLNWDAWTKDGTIDPGQYRVLATTDKFDHCVFTTREDFPQEREQNWLKVLFSMKYENPKHKEMMDLEGLKKWMPGRTSGFGALTDAVERQKFFEALNL